ncbi:uncharacterized protein LOC100679260 [Nasonia vitripennis]|uniref:Uncharacterized protein n=1 Tax=Nasonia vitripennis TaxID=7425 RepID=A0A7M7GLE6_NASVI|nr:uncharacterized protein LOC100679260 [Nasonia vitripennis]
MQSSHVAVVLLLMSLMQLQRASSTGFGVGRRLPGDEEILSLSEKSRGSADYVVNFAKTYSVEDDDESRLITRLVVEDAMHESGAQAAIIAGGPGQSFVSLAYTIPRYSEMEFAVRIYAKRPAFRKIP